MPPRKRRQSAQGDETGKEVNERQTPCQSSSNEGDKANKCSLKAADSSPAASERRLTARQQSKQENAAAEKQKDGTTSSADASAKQPTRFSTRVVKRPRRDLSPPESPVKKAGKKAPAAAAAATTTPETKGKRPWELWSVEDKDSFFEGLCEFGKDFESIHNLIVTKCKKKGSVMPVTVKNKEQVRHFYYRTWHKISKLIQPIENYKKDIQELYGLISYSILRKKIRGGVNPSDKNWQKLNELVHQGVATIKVKGKRIRVKTPVCNALKKLNNYEEPKREPGPRVPEKIRVEFRPKTNTAWHHVQSMAQNPRLRVTVRPERNLQSLVKFIETKWKPHRLKIKEGLNEVEPPRRELRVYPHRDSVVRCVNLSAIDEPVLQFCLTKHSKDSVTTSPSSNKRKKDKDVSVANKGGTTPANSDNLEAFKAVICDTKCCACKDECTSCIYKDPKGSLSKDAGKVLSKCQCKCQGDGERKETQAASGEERVGGGACLVSAGQNDMNSFSAITNFGSLSDADKKTGSGADLKSSNKNTLSGKDGSKCLGEIINSGSSLQSARTFSVPELSVIVDGENAMFPDLLPVQDHSVQQSEAEDPDIKPETTATDSQCSPNSKAGSAFLEDNTSKEEDVHSLMSVNSSQSEFERVCRDIMTQGWTSGDEETVTLAELYLMFGKNGELRFEYDWLKLKQPMENLQESVLLNLNNMLRRLSHLATVEFTDFTKSPGAGTPCQLCGHMQGANKKGKDKGKAKVAKTGRDIATQTRAITPKEVPISIAPVVTNNDGVFRVPVIAPHPGSQHRPINALASRDLMQRMAPANKPLMRPRKLKPVTRSRPVAGGDIVQRTILPKNSQMVTFYPVVANANLSGQPMEKSMVSQTIVGHPINGIQSQPVAIATTVPSTTAVAYSMGQFDTVTVTSPSSTTPLGVVEMSLSPDGDQTLMKIPAAHIGSMSAEALKAAGLSTTQNLMSSSLSGTAHQLPGSSNPLSTSTPVAVTKGSISPPNLSALLDISLPNMSTESESNARYMELETNTTFTGLLNDNSKPLSVDPGLTTPPIRPVTDQQQSSPLHSPPVRSLFRTSPNPENNWLNGDAQDLSLTSFLESPSKPATFTQNTTSMFNPTLPLNLFNESSRDSQSHKIDVDSTLHCMMNESSIDYVKKFADLAEQIVQNDAGTTQNKRP